MGGFGSGRRWMQSTTETCTRLDIRWLRKNGYLEHPNNGVLTWSCGDRKAGAIRYAIDKDKMELNYRSQSPSSSDWETVKQTIYFEETPCNYGGSRKWFTCPACYQRVGVLYGHGTYFYCRRCYKLPYRSNLQTQTDRLYTKKHELGRELFEHYEHGDGWGKKKGMHWKTYYRKYEEYDKLRRATDAVFFEQAYKLKSLRR